MNGIYVLIFIVTGHSSEFGPATATAEFNTKEACVVAVQELRGHQRSPERVSFAMCFPKGDVVPVKLFR